MIHKYLTRTGNITQDIDEAKSYLEKLDAFDYKFKIGDYYLNKWHFRSLINHYVTLANNGQMKDWLQRSLDTASCQEA